MNLIGIISSVILIQLVLLSAFLFTSGQGKKLSNRILACFFIWMALNIIDGLLTYSGFYTDHPALAHWEDGLVLLVGPLLYFYTQSVVYKDFSFSSRDLLHLAPFVIVTILFQVIYHYQTADYQKMIETAVANQTLPTGYYLAITLVYAQITLYFVLSFKVLSEYRTRIKEVFSTVTKVNLNWLSFMLGSVLIIFAVSMVYTYLPATQLREFFDQTIAVPFIFIFAFTNLVVWKGLKQPEIFMGFEREDKKYVGSTLSDPEKLMIRQQLDAHLKNERAFLNPDLTINELAERIDVSGKKLSQVINETYGQNFFDFINSFRIDEVCRILKESRDPGLTVSEVMYQCGFNSKSSFNTAFRKKTGVTPSEYRKQALSAQG